jgi:hypothetical protein
MSMQDEYAAAIRARLVAWTTHMSAWESETGMAIEDARANGIVPAAEEPCARLAAETLLISKRLRIICRALERIGPSLVAPRHPLSETPSAESRARKRGASDGTRGARVQGSHVPPTRQAGRLAVQPDMPGQPERSALRRGRGNAATRARCRVHMTHVDCGDGQWLHLAAIVDYRDQQVAGTRACFAWRSGGALLEMAPSSSDAPSFPAPM